jgi:O-antigen ligase
MAMTAISVRATEYGRPRTRLAVSPLRVLQIALAVFVLGNVGRIPILDLGDRMAPLLVNDLALGAVLLIGGFAMLQARSIQLNDVAIAAIVFATIGGLSTLSGVQRFGLNALEIVGSLAYLARWFVYFLLYVVIINCVRGEDTESVWKALERAMLVIVAFGIVQAIFLPNFAFIVYPDARPMYDYDQQRHRLVSTILEPNIVSGMIVSILLVQLARLSTGVAEPLWKPVLMFAGLVATLSRSGMLAFMVGGAALLLIRGPSKKLLKLGAVIFILLLPALPKLIVYAEQNARLTITDNSAMARIMMWQRALATFLDHPWFGIGFNTYGFVQERRGFERLGGAAYSVEGGLLFVAVMTGIVGLCVYMTMLWCVLRRSRSGWRSAHATPSERGIVVGTAVATVAILVHTMFVNSLLTPWVMEPLWVLWGISFLICVELRRRATAGAGP